MYIVAEKQYILRSRHVSQTQPNKKNRIYTYTVCIEVYANWYCKNFKFLVV